MQELRRKGTTKMTEDAAAGARSEDSRAFRWRGMTEQERALCKKNVADAKEALKCSDLTALQKRKHQDELKRVTEVIPKYVHSGSLGQPQS